MHARQLSKLGIIQAAWIQTFAHFMPRLSIRAAGKLPTKVLPWLQYRFVQNAKNICLNCKSICPYCKMYFIQVMP